MLKGVPSSGTRVEELQQEEAIWTLKCEVEWIADGTTRSDSRLGSLIILSGAVHTRVEVHRIDSEMSGLVEQPWLQLMCCAICLPRGCNFR